MTIIDKIKDLLRMLAENIQKRRKVVLALSCVVVFVTTYMLILPAFTLEKTKAAEQGGIDVPGITATTEDVSEDEEADVAGQADAEDAQAETGKTEDGKAEDSGSQSKDSGEAKADSAQTTDPLTFEDEHYTIAVDDKNSVLPENTEIKVEEIDKAKDEKKYEKHFNDALAAIQEEKDGENVSDLEFARFYDISLVSDGKEVTLGNGDKVSVNIEYDKELRKALGVENKDNIRIIHFAENKDTGKVEAEVLDNKEAKVTAETTEDNLLKEAAFDAESFSVYGLVYVKEAEEEAVEDKTADAPKEKETDSTDKSKGKENKSSVNKKNGIEELDLGTAVISPADGSYLPKDTEGHADVVKGRIAISKVKKTTKEETQSSAKYKVFDIALDNVNTEDYSEGFKVDVELPEKVTGKDFRLFHIHDGKVEELSLSTEGTVVSSNGMEEVSGFTFNTDNFSQFVLTYTVDFEYNGYTYSIEGEGKIKLSELFTILNINEDVKNVDKVEFSNKDLVKVSKDLFGGDWTIKSLKPFDTFETLTVILSNDKRYIINVTDDQVSTDMRDAVKSATMNGQSGDDWTVRPDEEYTVHLEFVEVPGSVQFPTTSNTLTYQLPDSFKPQAAVTGTALPLTYTEKSVTHVLQGCTFDVDTNGTVTIHLTDEAREKLATSGDGTFRIDVNGKFGETATQADFGGGNVKNITVVNNHEVDIQKSGSYSSADNKVHYTVYVKSTGSNSNVNVKDTLTGTALSLDTDSIRISGNSSEPTINSKTADGFDITFPTTKNGENIKIEYTASVDWNQITGKGTVEQTSNGITVKSNEDPEGDHEDNSVQHQIDYNPFTKTAGQAQSTADENKKTVPWTITVNGQGLKNMKNTTITDRITSGSDVMKYSGDGITIQKIDPNTGTVLSSTPVSWETLGVNKDSDSTWSYKITDDGKYKYVITYDTIVDVTGKNGNTAVGNTVGDGDHNTGGWTEVGPGSASIGVDKEFKTATAEEMTWTVKMDVPKEGLSKAVLTDTLPTRDYNGQKFADTLKEGSITIEGLQGSENYRITQSKGKFIITFYKDQDCTVPGLNSADNRREIKVNFTTENDPLWVANDRTGEHWNNVTFEADNGSVTDRDKGKLNSRGLEKQQHGTKEITINGEKYLAIQYTVDLYGITDADFTNNSFTFTDEYDEEYLKFLDLRGYDHKYGIDTWFVQILQNGNNGGDIADRSKKENDPAAIMPSENQSTGKLTFDIAKSQFPTNSDGTYYERYQLRYYLVTKEPIKDKLLPDSLEQDDRTVTLDNKATWGTYKDEVTVDYKYSGLIKTNVAPTGSNSTYDPVTGKTGFSIVINPDKLTLNDGNDMTLTDEFSGNLSVDYSSIRIVVDPDDLGKPISYDYRGNVGTFTIPDGHKVTITYDARVIGTPNSTVHYGNSVEMSGFTDSTDGYAYIGGSGDGGFNIYSLTLFKYDAGHMETGLNGAKFMLVDENGEPVVYPSHAQNGKAGQPITFTTANTSDGVAGYSELRLSEQEDGISLQKGVTYYLKEIESPASHAINNTIYRFTISDNPNYDNYEYHSGDILKVYDWPVLGKIELKKTIEGASNLTEEDKERIKFEVTGKYAEGPRAGQPILIDEWGYAIPAEDISKYSDEELSKCTEFSVSATYAEFTNGSYVMEDLVDGVYTVNETSATLPGFDSVNTTYKVDSSEHWQSGDTEAKVTIVDKNSHVIEYKNTYGKSEGSVDINIKKVNKTNAGNTTISLYGAKFKLEKENANNEYVVYNDTSVAEDGTFTIPYANKDTGVTLNALSPGNYRITEVVAPANYKKIGDGIFEFTVNNDGSVDMTSGRTFVDYDSDNQLFTVDNTEKHSYTVTKVDGANVSLKLPGAVFGVYVHENVEADKTADKSNPIITYTTDANGRFEINTEDYDWDTTGTTTYYFQEIKAPTGYSLPDDPGRSYFYFGQRPTDVAQTGAANLGSGSRTQTITNDLTELQVKKAWKKVNGVDDLYNVSDVDDIDSVEFKLFQTAIVKDIETGEIISQNEKQYPDEGTTYTVDAVNGSWNNAKTVIEKVPAVGERTKDTMTFYTYRVEEVVPDGYQLVSYTEENDGRTLIMTNKPESTSISAKKEWSDNTPEEAKNVSVKFQLQRKPADGSGEWENVNGGLKDVTTWNGSRNVPVNDDWSVTWDNLPKGYLYRVQEQIGFPTKFDITYSDNEEGIEKGEIVVTNTYNKTFIDVKKVWVDGGDTHYWIRFTLYRKSETYPEGEKAGEGSLDPSDRNYTIHFADLDKVDDHGKEWKYYVIEDDYQGYLTTYSADADSPIDSGTIYVTNTKENEDKLAVKKLWLDENGNPTNPPEGTDSISVQLKKQVGAPNPNGVNVTAIFQGLNWNGSEVVVSKESVTKVKANSTIEVGFKDAPDADKVSVSGGTIVKGPETVDGYTKYTIEVNSDSVVITAKKLNHYNAEAPVFISAEQDIIYGDPENVGEPITLNEASNWAHRWDNLPAEDNIKYFIEEISSIDGYVTSYENNDGIKTGIIVVNNKKTNTVEVSLDIMKLKKNTQEPLAGAVFSAVKIDGTATSISEIGEAVEKTTGGDGAASFDSLTNGYYQITETKAPEGYVLTNDVFYIKVEGNEVSLLTMEQGKKPEEWSTTTTPYGNIRSFEAQPTNNKAIATIDNDQGTELPMTGGIGTTIFYILGAILVIGGGIYFISRRRAMK